MFITFSSLFSFKDTPSLNIDIPHLDKLVHFAFYFIATILGILFLRERSKGNRKLVKAVLAMLFFTVLYGIAMELLQHNFTLKRQGDIFDGIANTLGSLCAAILAKRYFSSKSGLKWRH